MRTITIVSILLGFSNAFGCPELSGVDLANGDGPWSYTELESYDISLTKEEFLSIPSFSDSNYEYCKDALYVQRVQDKASGKVFSALMTGEDHCDGGNSYGALYDDKMTQILGSIGDSYISCNK